MYVYIHTLIVYIYTYTYTSLYPFPPHQPTPTHTGTDRRAALQSTYGFTCHCPLCLGGPSPSPTNTEAAAPAALTAAPTHAAGTNNDAQQPPQAQQQEWTTPDRARAFTCPVEECDGPVCPFGVEGAYWTCLSCGRAALPLEVCV